MAKHPKDYGFQLGLKIKIGSPASIEPAEGAHLEDVVYVAMLRDRCLKVGETGLRLIDRWRGLATIFGERKLRDNEAEDRRKWLEVADGEEVLVWVKQAKQIPSDFVEGTWHSARHSQEDELDDIYEPLIGRPLKQRRSRSE